MLDGQNVYWVDRERLGVDDVREGRVEGGERRLSRDEVGVDEWSPVYGYGEHWPPGVSLLHNHPRQGRPAALVHEELSGVCGDEDEVSRGCWVYASLYDW